MAMQPTPSRQPRWWLLWVTIATWTLGVIANQSIDLDSESLVRTISSVLFGIGLVSALAFVVTWLPWRTRQSEPEAQAPVRVGVSRWGIASLLILALALFEFSGHQSADSFSAGLSLINSGLLSLLGCAVAVPAFFVERSRNLLFAWIGFWANLTLIFGSAALAGIL